MTTSGSDLSPMMNQASYLSYTEIVVNYVLDILTALQFEVLSTVRCPTSWPGR